MWTIATKYCFWNCLKDRESSADFYCSFYIVFFFNSVDITVRGFNIDGLQESELQIGKITYIVDLVNHVHVRNNSTEELNVDVSILRRYFLDIF